MMTWEQKFAALCALAPYDMGLRMRAPGNWYVTSAGLSIGGDGFLRSIGGDGATPEKAVENAWTKLTTLPSDRYIHITGTAGVRRHVRWNGYMWHDLPVPASAR